jgi:hydrogenase assembly chaperone HypC/HupF
MSVALPGCIISCSRDVAEIDMAGLVMRADVGLIDRPRPGDWVLLCGGVALSRINRQTADDMLGQLRALDSVK